jgi:hypothetical protein
VSPVDVYGKTPLDNARQKGNDAIAALLLVYRGKSGSDPGMHVHHETILKWVADREMQKLQRRKDSIMNSLPLRKMVQHASAVNTALRKFAQV